MPVYEYICPECQSTRAEVYTIAEYSRLTGIVCTCGFWMKRIYDVQFASVMQEHTNPQFGTVSDPRKLSDAAKRAGEAASLRTGIEHNYVAADPTDPTALGVTGVGLDATAKTRRARGLPVPKTPFT